MNWISIDDRLPDEGVQVLVHKRDSGMDVAYYDRDRGWCFPFWDYDLCISADMGTSGFWDIVAWMPLPEPYKERKENV